MPSIGVNRRIEAANHRIDAAVAAIVPDVERPQFGRNRGKAEMLRAEWLADTLEAFASDGEELEAGVPDFSEWTDDEVHNLAVDVGIDVSDEISRPELVAAIIGTVDLDELNEIIAPDAPDGPESDEDTAEGGNTQGDDSDAPDATGAAEGAALPAGDDLAAELDAKTLDELKPLAAQLEIPTSQKKADLIAAIVAKVEAE